MRILTLLGLLCLLPTLAVAGTVPTDPGATCPIKPGQPVPEGLTAHRADGTAVDLSALLSEPTVLVVFRGGWCPFCNRHLEELREVEAEIAGLGYQLIGISPDRPGKAAEMAEKLGESSFLVLSDSPMEVAQALGLAFEVDAAMLEKLGQYGIDIEADSGYDHHWLPVPAAMVITDSVVRFNYANPDYQMRVDGDVLLAAARAAMKGDDTGR